MQNRMPYSAAKEQLCDENYCSAVTITAGPDVPPDSSIEKSLLPVVIATVLGPMFPVPFDPSETVALTPWVESPNVLLWS